MGGTSTKESYYIHQDNIEITPPQLDNAKRLLMILDSIPCICENIKLSHDPDQFYILSKTFIMEFLKGVSGQTIPYYNSGSRKYNIFVDFYLYIYSCTLT